MIQLIDSANIERRFFKDGVFLQEVLDSYKITCSECLRDIKQSVQQNAPSQLAKALHKLKGSTLNFTDKSFTKKIEEFETAASESSSILISSDDIAEIESQLFILIEQLSLLAKKWKNEL